MARPSKSIGESRHHSTKAEIESRRAWEARIASDGTLRMNDEVAADDDARAIFLRMKTAFAEAGLDDSLYSEGLNGYCLIRADILRITRERNELAAAMSPAAAAPLVSMKDRIIAKLRDQALAWERENIGTIAGKLRAIPKKPEADEADNVTGIAALMARRAK